MVYVITQACCNDASCVEVCPVNCIHPTPDEAPFATTEMLYIDPDTCIDCGACVDECPVDAIYADNELPAAHEPYLKIAEDYYRRYPIGPDWPEERDRTKIPAELGTLRVAIVGSGPAACYAALELTGRARVEVDIFDRLPTPYGLVRAGVAPDHQSTKAVGELFRSALGHKKSQCWFNVEVGTHISHEELLAHHHAVLYAVGAAGDRRLDVPGEDLPGSHAATEFVAWYNGHPDYADRTFDLSGERAVIVGNGNVALDVARALVMDPDELAKTDMADHAVAALRESNIREVVVVGRRGPAQAAYTNPELLALGQLTGVDIVVDPAEAELDPASRALVDDPTAEPRIALKVEQVQGFAQRRPTEGNKRIVLRFLAAPVELSGDGRVESITLERTELVEANGRLEAHRTGQTETLATGLVLRSVGYRGAPVADLPFDDQRGILPNEEGRVVDPETNEPLPGVYTAGWIKRGPTGVIGTNKQCSAQTVEHLVQDFVAGRLVAPVADREKLAALVSERRPEYVDYRGWQQIDKQERARGGAAGRSRVKFVAVADLLAASRIES
ncbi:4Fe-4S binding protein [Rhodococcus aetherivorans]|uniref:ferredoxin--NADP(+) reductase n=1 Tax=Rhodococcus aetherivorans TaxID=191292 RepID=A0AA46SEM5_9NOCA|nr:FAD-dependent oxidoreductase [Rhodococcus aetherivorans]KDE10723.1 ferredoxin [Rhodococcus aetherivorans]UYF95147.1 4Fe-4S binding protein [Rhodococcus aetherivorans]